MRISQDVRDYAASRGVDEQTAIELGMKEKSAEFVAAGVSVYQEPVVAEPSPARAEPEEVSARR
jgi:hypothetical protein